MIGATGANHFAEFHFAECHFAEFLSHFAEKYFSRMTPSEDSIKLSQNPSHFAEFECFWLDTLSDRGEAEVQAISPQRLILP